MKDSISILEAQPDYLTCTTKTLDDSARLWDVAYDSTRRQEAAGNRVRDFGAHGFKGKTCGQTSWAWRGTEFLLRASGAEAATIFPLAMPIAANVSRIDLQVTARFEEGAPHLAIRTYGKAQRFPKGRGRPVRYGCYFDNRKGETFTIGSGKSDFYARLYNKEAESGDEHYQDAWRWELEIKGKAAKPVAAALAGAGDRHARIADYLYDYFTKRGACPPWDTLGIPVPTPSGRGRSDADRVVDWLRLQVRPALGRLAVSGRLADGVKALGLADPALAAMVQELAFAEIPTTG